MVIYLLTFGLFGGKRFNRKKFVEETFHPNDIASVETDPIAVQLKAGNIRYSMYQEEAAFDNRRAKMVSVLSLWIAILSLIVSIFSLIRM